MNYRKVNFEYKEWKTWDGKFASGYTCSDQKLLKGLNTVSFGAKTIVEMQDMIDDYIDRRSDHLKFKAQYGKAMDEFMKK